MLILLHGNKMLLAVEVHFVHSHKLSHTVFSVVATRIGFPRPCSTIESTF